MLFCSNHVDLGGIDLTDEAALEAELRALEGNTSSKSSKAEKSGSGLMDHLDTVAAGLEGLGESDGEDSDLSEGEEAELLGELEVCGERTEEMGGKGGVGGRRVE